MVGDDHAHSRRPGCLLDERGLPRHAIGRLGHFHPVSATRAEERQVGDNALFFGCRRSDQDYIYQDELESFEADGTLKLLALAFSRDTVRAVRPALPRL